MVVVTVYMTTREYHGVCHGANEEGKATRGSSIARGVTNDEDREGPASEHVEKARQDVAVKVGQWMESTFGRRWPSAPSEFAEYLEAIVMEPCAKSAPEAAYKTDVSGVRTGCFWCLPEKWRSLNCFIGPRW